MMRRRQAHYYRTYKHPNTIKLPTCQVDILKAANRGLEDQRDQLTKSNDKLADDEGRWYSLARELESQLEVIKKASLPLFFILK